MAISKPGLTFSPLWKVLACFGGRFWEPNGRLKGAKMHPKIDLKIDSFWSAFFDGCLIAMFDGRALVKKQK